MKLIVGLGNPGTQHEKNRHNAGFMVVERFLKNFEVVIKTVWDDQKKFKSDTAEIEWKPKVGSLEKIILCKPKTYMNNSGMAVSLLASFYKMAPEDIWVVNDDVDLPLGSLRIRFGGASAGHRGIESIISALRTDKFWRFRMGVGHPLRSAKISSVDGRGNPHKFVAKDIDDFVLGNFSTGEWGKTRELIKRGAKAIACALEESMTSAMNKFNSK